MSGPACRSLDTEVEVRKDAILVKRVGDGFRPPFWLRSAHVQTIWPTVFRRVRGVRYIRERITLPDGDFLDLDWSRVGGRRLAVIAHGLEGNSQRTYVTGLVQALNRRGWDVLAWNLRGCSGEANRLPRSYHSGASEDLEAVVAHVARCGHSTMAVVGFSLGGNLTLKFLGEDTAASRWIHAGAAVSVPCDLRGAAMRMAEPGCALYLRRFLNTMMDRMDEKRLRFGRDFPCADRDRIRNFRDFDDAFTAPLHGFADAEEYWEKCSSRRFLAGIRVPTLILNAADDPFLSSGCFPCDASCDNPCLVLDCPEQGGHVGFVGGGALPGEYWSEWRLATFLESVLPT